MTQKKDHNSLATKADVKKAKATIARLTAENARLKMRSHIAQAHFAGLQAEVEDLRRRLGITRRKKR